MPLKMASNRDICTHLIFEHLENFHGYNGNAAIMPTSVQHISGIEKIDFTSYIVMVDDAVFLFRCVAKNSGLRHRLRIFYGYHPEYSLLNDPRKEKNRVEYFRYFLSIRHFLKQR